MSKKDVQLLNREQLAEKLGCTVRAVRNLEETGKIPCFRINHRMVRYDLEKVMLALGQFEIPAVKAPAKATA